tara:strand:- start:305 stop:631 length:327 start_codon:yes stop_codon:yes gene_type:complete
MWQAHDGNCDCDSSFGKPRPPHRFDIFSASLPAAFCFPSAPRIPGEVRNTLNQQGKSILSSRLAADQICRRQRLFGPFGRNSIHRRFAAPILEGPASDGEERSAQPAR